ncbi:MAG: biotin--[acetyl-CoA-carboxylase] ligase [Roseivirga sp.]|nr:biotin--[acetyl-CoA-carboxylase] ligase [Roseivirga sp.]
MPTCHSTNEVAREMAQKPDTLEGTVIICQSQTKGRGQRGNSWESDPGQNLTLSIVLRPGFLKIQEQFFLNIITSLAVRDVVTHFLPKADVKVKWPNDVLIGNRKTAGILIENVINRNRIEYAVIGIGLNVNQTAFATPRATSLRIESGVSFDTTDVFEQLMSSIEHYYLKLKSGRLKEVKSEYLQYLFGFRQKRNYLAEFRFEGVIEDVTDTGFLVVSDKRGRQNYDFKEIEFIY